MVFNGFKYFVEPVVSKCLDFIVPSCETESGYGGGGFLVENVRRLDKQAVCRFLVGELFE